MSAKHTSMLCQLFPVVSIVVSKKYIQGLISHLEILELGKKINTPTFSGILTRKNKEV